MGEVPQFLRALEEHDPEFFKLVSSVMELATSEGALDPKTKTLIILAIDAAGSQTEGVRALARRARALGASEGEISEAIRLAFLGAGVPGLVTGLAAFEE